MAYDITITVTENADAVRLRDAYVGLYGPLEDGETAFELFEEKIKESMAEVLARYEGDEAAKAARVAAVADINANVAIDVSSVQT